MQYTTLGRTGVTVSRLCFGTMSFGGDADEAMSARMFARCREAGINFFDCANVYSAGKAEEILGRLMRDGRDQLVITSKAGMPVKDQPINGRGLSRRLIFQQIDVSLKRLGTDHLDVYFYHCDDFALPQEEILRSMDDLVRLGKVRYIGASNWSAWRIALALGISERECMNRIAVLQPMYSLAKRTAEVEILPLARAQGLGVISYSPLGGGLLTGKYASAQPAQGRLTGNAMYAKRYEQETYRQTATRFAEYAAKAGVSPVTLAVAWVKSHPGITAPIIGARNLEQLEPSLAAGDYTLSDQQRQEIAGLTPPVPVATDRDEERA
jgi:aryl-alcohol dehydrogenase-like predicted oxidoreductase